MRNRQKQSGFSAVELLITLFIASVFLLTGFQLYAAILKNGGDARQQSSASNVAADYLQQYTATATSPCTPGTPLLNSPASGQGLTNATVTVTISCPNITVSSFSAAGGNITKVNGYTIHTFTSSGTFTVLNGSNNIDVLVVGGGGGGANTGAGGGAGGYIYKTKYKVSSGPYTVTVGPGGNSNPASGNNGFKGSDSVFNDITAEGGGYGASHSGSNNPGGNGGSGGGGGIRSNTAGSPGGTASSGNAGGAGWMDPSWIGGSGGGGGAGTAGSNGTNSQGSGNGGTGLSNSISGTAVTYAGGGGGGEVNGNTYVGLGGSNIGGAAVVNAAGGSGVANTGCGGAGGSFNGGIYNIGGAGGSGIVIVRYPTPNPTILTNVSKIVSTVTYGNSQKTVSTSTYVSTPGIVTNGLALNLDAGLTASYPGSGNTWTDLGPNGANGTLVGGITVSGANGGNLAFDGSSAGVNLNPSPALNLDRNFTISAWFKNRAVSYTGGMTLVTWGEETSGKRRGLYLWNGGSGGNKVDYSSYASNLYGTTTVADGTWYHGDVTVDANGLAQVYVNGVLENTGYVTLTPYSYSGTHIANTGGYYQGDIGNVQIYNRVLAANEITQNYNALKGRYALPNIVSSGLVSNFDAGQDNSYPGSGSTWTDISPNGYVGTLGSGVKYNSANNGSMGFDGTTNAYVNVNSNATSNFTSNGTFTISAWLKPDTLVSGWRRSIIRQETYLASGYRFGFGNGGNPIFWTDQSGGTLQLGSSANLSTSAWTNVTVTYNNQQAYMYVNGVQTGSATGTYVAGAANVMSIGNIIQENYSGSMSNVMSYGRALSPSEVLQNYNALRGRYGL